MRIGACEWRCCVEQPQCDAIGFALMIFSVTWCYWVWCYNMTFECDKTSWHNNDVTYAVACKSITFVYEVWWYGVCRCKVTLLMWEHDTIECAAWNIGFWVWLSILTQQWHYAVTCLHNFSSLSVTLQSDIADVRAWRYWACRVKYLLLSVTIHLDTTMTLCCYVTPQL